MEALEALSRRSLIEHNQACCTQQSVVTEYVTEQFIEQVSEEIASEQDTTFFKVLKRDSPTSRKAATTKSIAFRNQVGEK